MHSCVGVLCESTRLQSRVGVLGVHQLRDVVVVVVVVVVSSVIPAAGRPTLVTNIAQTPASVVRPVISLALTRTILCYIAS